MSKKKVSECTEIRKIWNEKESKWFYAVIDIVHLFSKSPNPGEYLKKLKKYKPNFKETFQKFTQIFLIQTSDGPRYLNCVSEHNYFELIKYLPCRKSKSYINFFFDYENSKIVNEELFLDVFKMKYLKFQNNISSNNPNSDIGNIIIDLPNLIKTAEIHNN